ncbi:M15 family metallopeptidase [Pontibacillus salipaludis]|uniref:M15 family metallopeptidase n=1 Tax=Pontibacillus salipaludis TaxID=1697394 RepID=UPI0031E76296
MQKHLRILANIVAFLILLLGTGALLLWFIANTDSSGNSVGVFQPLEKKDTPMPTELHPEVEKAKNELLNRAKEKGISVVITDGHRSIERQNELYEQGRSGEGSVVTNADGGESYHNYGLAIDFALKTNRGDVVWDTTRDGNGNGKADWMEVVSIAKDLGFEWGGDWSSFKDYPHLQMDFGLSIRELQYGKRPKVEKDTNKATTESESS